ncbi:ABHD16B [Callithrix jacchus]|uniref:Abhydrolase domain containing 16B n=1 Tax=Callithrix jacchus TaxID=9483 RepID=F7GMU7_CALJA|nr:protein ABHD16B [Callithrix jacchus]
MCVICFMKALVHVFKIYLTASYTYTFRGWPVDFRWDDVCAAGGSSSHRALTCMGAAAGVWLLRDAALGGEAPGRPSRRARSQVQCLLQQLRELPSQLASYVLAHSLGRWLVYPGSVSLMTRALLPLLQQGQERLQERYHGRRAKLVACDGNEIDTMFMDRRQQPGSHGHGLRLVICCEGNAGFYEMGCLFAPLEAGYSVLGWNHPGFGGSTGVPSPQHDANAMDVVVNYALHRLRFSPAHVVVYGWSVGGFTATWATMTYPELGALVLDATFDDLVPLALKVMPHSCKGLVVRTVRKHFNLNVAEQLCCYLGPVLLLRRTQDDVVSTSGRLRPQQPGDVEGNRGNELLLRLLQQRYPAVMAGEGQAIVTRWLRAGSLAQEAAFYARYRVDEKQCLELLQSYRARCEKQLEGEEAQGPRGPGFPWLVGQGLRSRRRRQLALFLARKHLKNVEATHCSPLEPEDFQLPWGL